MYGSYTEEQSPRIMAEIEETGIAVDDILDDPKKLKEKAKLELLPFRASGTDNLTLR